MRTKAQGNMLRTLLGTLLSAVALEVVCDCGLAAPASESMAGARRSVEQLASRLEEDLRGVGLDETRSQVAQREAVGASTVPFDLVAHTREFYRELVAEADVPQGDGTLATEALVAVPSATVEQGPATVTAARAPVRAEPAAVGQVVAFAEESATVEVLGEHGRWRKVLLDSGAVGWLDAEHLGPEQTLEEKQGAAIVQEALQYVGVPYVHGGQSRAGMDCSGLVFSVMGTLGKRVPRTAATLFGVGMAVTRDALRAGDLVFFTGGSKPGISHVGIYTGNGKIVHASSGIGSVGVSSLDSPYYRRHYAGARRVLP